MTIVKFRIITVSLTIFLILFFVLGSLFCVQPFSPEEFIKSTTGAEMPQNMEILWHHRDTGFRPGRHAQYTVFQLEEKPTSFLLQHNFSNEENRGMKMHFSHMGFTDISADDIPIEFIPNWEDAFYWAWIYVGFFLYYTNSLIFIVWIQGR